MSILFLLNFLITFSIAMSSIYFCLLVGETLDVYLPSKPKPVKEKIKQFWIDLCYLPEDIRG